jgi:formyltetrahydrofolate-dependent phosphoribosylglycinamide formyltransferase
MLKQLQHKWKVSHTQLFLILCVFAVTGTTTAYLSRQVPIWLQLDKNTAAGLRWTVRLIILIFGYQLILLFVAFLFGQFPFFWQFEKKLLQRLRIMKPIVETSKELASGSHQNRIAIFASGAGSNAQEIIRHFKDRHVNVVIIGCNKKEAGVWNIAAAAGVESFLIEKAQFLDGDAYVPLLQRAKIDLIVLAGFLWKIPQRLIDAYPHRIINIHPALLPKYGGKGMYGKRVHEAVIAAGESESGITIHYVDEHYDHGDIIFQAKCPVLGTDTPEILAKRIHELEHRHFPLVVEKLIKEITNG